jgi:NhaP-type Na+/H+ or K+/H+ antiporter
VEDVPNWEIVVFIVAAVVAGGLAMGGITLVYFLDKWRVDPQERSAAASDGSRGASRFDEAA